MLNPNIAVQCCTAFLAYIAQLQECRCSFLISSLTAYNLLLNLTCLSPDEEFEEDFFFDDDQMDDDSAAFDKPGPSKE